MPTLEIWKIIGIVVGVLFNAWFIWMSYDVPRKTVLNSIERRGEAARHWKKIWKYLIYGTGIDLLIVLFVYGSVQGINFKRDTELFIGYFLALWAATLFGIYTAYSKSPRETSK